MTAFSGRAADLSVGSVVASATNAFINDGPDEHGNAWYAISDGTAILYGDDRIDEAIRDGAQVLRVGDGR